MRWQVYRLARLIGKVVRFQHRGTHWWAAPFYQKQRNRYGLNNWLDCLASWYTSICVYYLKQNGQSAFAKKNTRVKYMGKCTRLVVPVLNDTAHKTCLTAKATLMFLFDLLENLTCCVASKYISLCYGILWVRATLMLQTLTDTEINAAFQEPAYIRLHIMKFF